LFFLEAALDRGYFQELLARTERISEADKELIKPLVVQEVDTFHLMLATRGTFHYRLSPELVAPLHIRWTGIPSERFSAMLAAPDIITAARFAVGRVIDALPLEQKSSESSIAVDPAMLEALAWKRFLRLSNRAFRRSHMGLGAVVGYVGLRRVEVANLISLSEGVRTGMGADAIRKRLIPRTDLETVYV
jgi:vacuolar-type H+-ATPase subunit C/Vma6